jgi:hypothetical protein
MAASYPGSVWAGQVTPALQSDSPTHSEIHDRVAEEIVAIESELGVTPSGSQASVRARFDLMTPASWTVTGITQSGAVAVTTGYGWKVKFEGGLFFAHIAMNITAAGTAGSAIQVPTPYTLTSSESVGGDFAYFDNGTTNYAGTVMPVSTTYVAFQVSGQTGTLGATPNFATASGDILRVSLTGWAA